MQGICPRLQIVLRHVQHSSSERPYLLSPSAIAEARFVEMSRTARVVLNCIDKCTYREPSIVSERSCGSTRHIVEVLLVRLQRTGNGIPQYHRLQHVASVLPNVHREGSYLASLYFGTLISLLLELALLVHRRTISPLALG